LAKNAKNTSRYIARERFPTMHGLPNEYLMAVDFTECRETGRHFSFSCNLRGCRLIWLSAWHCHVAKYP